MEDEKDIIEGSEEIENEEISEDASHIEDPADDAEENAEANEENETAEEEASEDSEEEKPEDEGVSIDDFEYDEDGNIINPEGIEDEEPSTEDAKESAEEAKEPAAEKEDEKEEEDPRDALIRSLKEELLLLKTQGKDTLKALGVEKEDVLEGLAELAAEAEDVSTDEYLKKRDDLMKKARDAEAARLSEFEVLAAKDLAELQAEYPEAKKYKHVRDMPEKVLKKFAELRNKGVSAVDAYASANRDGIRSYAAKSAKKATSNGKEHLQSSIPKASKSTAPKMTRADLEYWRGMFPKKSDKEIIAIYRKTY